MSIFCRGWLPYTPPMNFNPLTIGVSFLVNIGYGGPIAGDAQYQAGITCAHIHAWPPFGASPSTPRRHLLRSILTPETEYLAEKIWGLAARVDDALFIETIRAEPDAPLVVQGVCIAPAVEAGDPLIETSDPIEVGDLALIQLRGALQPLAKIFAGFIDRHGQRKALFYLKTPEQVIEVEAADILYARRIEPPREITGHSLLAAADPFVPRLRAEHGVDGALHPVGESRREAWLESMLAILARLRVAPA